MERYKLFIDEIKEENKRIIKKTIYINNKIKYKVINNNVINFYKYFINSYENEKTNNVYKYFKHKLRQSKRKKRYLSPIFPYFEIYKNTNKSFKNNLNAYKIFEIIKNYNELQLFDFCSEKNYKNYTYLFSHFIEIIIRKRDLYDINHLLILTNNLKKLNYYHPYFCKLICREVYCDIYKIKDLNKITDFINFLMYFNIFNFYYMNKFYAYIFHLIIHRNQWKIKNNENDIYLKDKLYIEDNTINNKDNTYIQINNKDVHILINSFLKYKYFDINILKLFMYLCNNPNYNHLKNEEYLYNLSKLMKHYIFININYCFDFFSLYKNILKEKENKLTLTSFLLFIKTLYKIRFNIDKYLIQTENEKTNEITNIINEIEDLYYVLINNLDISFYLEKQYSIDKKNINDPIYEYHDYILINKKNKKKKLLNNEITFLPFNNNIDINLKKQNIKYSFLNDQDKNKSIFNDKFINIIDIIKYIILFMELKIIKNIPLQIKKTNEEIEFLKGKNFEKDTNKNIYRYISKNIDQKTDNNFVYILKQNKKEIKQFDDSNFDFLFYLNYINNKTFKKKNEQNIFYENKTEHDIEKKEVENNTLTLNDINKYLKNKENIQFNLKDKTYFSHIFSNLSSEHITSKEEIILQKCFQLLLSFKYNLQIIDVNKIADIFYYFTVFQIIQGIKNLTIQKNEYRYFKIKDFEINELYKILSNILIKKFINIKEDKIYKVIMSCSNTAYSNVYLNHFLKNFNRYIKFSKLRKHMNC